MSRRWLLILLVSAQAAQPPAPAASRPRAPESLPAPAPGSRAWSGAPAPIVPAGSAPPIPSTTVDLSEIAARAFSPATPDALTLTMPQTVERALRQNKLLEVRKLDPAIARAKVMQERGAFDQTLVANVQRQHNKIPASSALTGASVAESDTRVGNLDYHAKFQEGSTLDFTVNNQRQETNSRFQTLNPSFASNLGISLVKPLLRNGGFDVATANLRIARNAVVQNMYRLKKSVLDTVASVQTAYWNLVFARQDRQVKKFSLEAARELLRYNEARRAEGLGSDVEVVEADTTVQTRSDDLDVAERTVHDSQEALRQQLSVSDRPAGVELVPVQGPGAVPVPVPLEEAMTAGFARRPDRLDAVMELTNRDIRMAYLANQKEPRIDLVATYLQNGLAGQLGDALDQATGADFPGYTVGVQVELPLTDRLARGNYRQGQLEKKQAILNLKAIEDQVQADVTRAVRELDTNLRRVTVARRGAELAARALDAAEERYRQGLIANFDLLRFQQDLADARSRALRAVIDAQNSGIAVGAATGQLLESQGIVVEDTAPVFRAGH